MANLETPNLWPPCSAMQAEELRKFWAEEADTAWFRDHPIFKAKGVWLALPGFSKIIPYTPSIEHKGVPIY